MKSSQTSRRPKTLSFRSKVANAFTLVELLVVIGIIALLISILLPALNKVREQSQTTKCMANMHSIFIAMRAYSVEYKDSLPWGFIWEKTAVGVPRSAGTSDQKFLNWASSLSRYMGKKNTDIGIAGDYSRSPYYQNAYSESFRCPAIDQSFSQVITYAPLTTAMPNWYEEVNAASITGTTPLRPAKFTDLYSDNTIMWDGPAWIKLKAEHPNEYITGNTIQGGYGNTAFTFIDDDQLDASNPPEYRFRDKSPVDPYYDVPFLAQGFPINIPSKIAYSNSNTDIGGTQIQYGQCNVPRFRHNKERACNALIADGSVRTFTIKDIKRGGGHYYNDANAVESDWLRKYIMIKIP